jgi:CheY-like chemotaxis protein
MAQDIAVKGEGELVGAVGALKEPKVMATVLVVDDDLQLRHALTRELRSYGYEARSAGGYDEALQCLRERPYDVLLTDLRMEGRDGMDLIVALRESSPGTRPVLMSAHASARDSQRALDLGAVRVLSKPFDSQEMLHAVECAAECAGGFMGSVHGMSLVDMLQMFHYGRRSLSVRVLGGVPAAVHMRDGQIVHAEYGAEQGDAALALILRMPAGSLRTSSLEAVKPSIRRDFQELLLDQLRVLDEQHRDSAAPGARVLADDALFSELEDPDAKSDGPASKVIVPQSPFGSSSTSGERPVIRVPEKRKTMDKINIACQRVVKAVDGAVACGVIDIETGTVLGIHNESDYSEEQNDMVAAATKDLFRGPSVARIEAMVRYHRGDEEQADHCFEEIQLTSKHNLHFAKTLRSGRAVIMLVTKRSTSVGMGWAQLKAAIPVLERLMP